MRTAVLIGEEGLLTICGDHLLSQGIEITGVLTRARRIIEWAADYNIFCAGSYDELMETTPEAPSVLFSITNFSIIPQRVLEWVGGVAINFHDGPLPEMAGLNTPAWSLLAGRRTHAITWHQVTSDVDAGSIVLRRDFDIPSHATAFDLNTLCFEHAVDSFPLVLDRLADIHLGATGTPPAHYYGRDQKLAQLGYADWTWSAEVLIRMFRASETRGFRNPVGTLKFVHDLRTFTIRSAEPAAPAQGTPGLVLEGGTAPVVACGDGAVTISAQDLASGAAWTPDAGTQLSPCAQFWAEFENGDSICLNEQRWIEYVRASQPTVIPNLSSSTDRIKHCVSFELDMSASNQDILGAVMLLLSLLNGSSRVSVMLNTPTSRSAAAMSAGYLSAWLPITLDVCSSGFSHAVDSLLLGAVVDVAVPTDIGARYPEISDALDDLHGSAVRVAMVDGDAGFEDDADILIDLSARRITINCALSQDSADLFDAQAEHIFTNLQAIADRVNFDHMTAQHRKLITVQDAQSHIPTDYRPFPELFTETAAANSDRTAIVDTQGSWSFQTLNTEADRVALFLQNTGVVPGSLIGVLLAREARTVAVLLGILKSGCAYVPLDPLYPPERTEFIVEDSRVARIITDGALAQGLSLPARVHTLDEISRVQVDKGAVNERLSEDQLAYVIYTSGSTGKPKGVEVTHGNLSNFLHAMNQQLGRERAHMLSVTSISFDISVLEYWWTLGNGGKVVLYDPSGRQRAPRKSPAGAGPAFSLYFWNTSGEEVQRDAYALLLDCAKWGDAHGFHAIWTPERHFGSFGGAYPNPSVTSAAIAAVTSRIGIRAGSCVLPLHQPIRVAEEWAVVDTLSKGRVGISFAAGWMPNDFAIFPGNFATAKSEMYPRIDLVRRLWRGETIQFPGPTGDVAVRTLPRPVQAELPVWITTAGNVESFKEAGRQGYSVLTHLLGQDLSVLANNIQAYRSARMSAGHDGHGHVTLMLHTLVAESNERAREIAATPMKEFLRASLHLIKDAAWEFPTFAKFSDSEKADTESFFSSLSDEDLDALLDFAFLRYFETSGLFGSVDHAAAMVEKCRAVGVGEIGCLIDFGIEPEHVMSQLPYLQQLQEQCGADTFQEETLQTYVADQGITHLQCTPAQFNTLLLANDKDALDGIQHLLLGGEALNQDTADQACSLIPRVTNMYGPTETTVWSLTKDLQRGAAVTLGTPIANTVARVIDSQGRQCPLGVVGELLIGGEGVSRGYLGNERLTCERFIEMEGRRFYRTGDEVRMLADGEYEFIGRNDNQVKVRGYRIELGEIENTLSTCPGVRTAVALAGLDKWGAHELLAVLLVQPGRVTESALRKHLAARLPDYMIPTRFFFEDSVPYTPNGKIDRKALAERVCSGDRTGARESEKPAREMSFSTAADASIEGDLHKIWSDLLQRDDFTVNDNFFEIGGHSILAVRMQGQISRLMNMKVPISIIFQNPTISGIAARLGTGSARTSALQDKAQRRAARRKRLKQNR